MGWGGQSGGCARRGRHLQWQDSRGGSEEGPKCARACLLSAERAGYRVEAGETGGLGQDGQRTDTDTVGSEAMQPGPRPPRASLPPSTPALLLVWSNLGFLAAGPSPAQPHPQPMAVGTEGH